MHIFIMQLSSNALLLLICLVGCASAANCFKFIPVASNTPICSSPSPVASARSDIDCAVACAGNSTCRSFSYAKLVPVCMVSDRDNCALIPGVTTMRKKPSDMQVTFLQRFIGNVNFARSWTDYENGFGDFGTGDFWLGLRNISAFTDSVSSATMRVEMKLWNGESLFVEYNGFKVGPSNTNYRMTYANVGNYSYPLSPNAFVSNAAFSTMDRDNDVWSDGSCSATFNGNGGFWMSNCGSVFPTAVLPAAENNGVGYVRWWTFLYGLRSLKEIRMHLKL